MDTGCEEGKDGKGKAGVRWEYGLSPGRNRAKQRKTTTRNHTYSGASNSRQHSPARYTLKYLGVTNGQIGILSTKRPIPHMSYMEACPSSPLPMIYASLSRKVLPPPENNGKFLKEELTFIETHARNRLKPDEKRKTSFKNDHYLVHKYSLPRGLVAIHNSPLKSTDKSEFDLRFELEKQKRFPTPRLRRGMSGWMLSTIHTEEQTMLPRFRRKKDMEKTGKSEEITTGEEVYLKYLKLKEKVRRGEKGMEVEGKCI